MSTTNEFVLDFERPVQILENQIKELRQASLKPGVDISAEVEALQKKADILAQSIYDGLSNWQRVQLSRHPLRPHCIDYINLLIDDFYQIHGDRRFADDPAIIAGLGLFKGQKVVVVGIEKGRKTKEKIHHNFGMPRPEGYRKALRAMKLAEQFSLPIIVFVDTPGAYPGIDAEERGQSQAIAENLQEMFGIKVPILAVVIGEGGSGGALAVAIADKVWMMEYSVYSVISPESCASILWADPKKAEVAANALELNPQKALELGVIDDIIREPIGGAHRNHEEAAKLVGEKIEEGLKETMSLAVDDLLEKRYLKFRLMGNKTIVDISSN